MLKCACREFYMKYRQIRNRSPENLFSIAKSITEENDRTTGHLWLARNEARGLRVIKAYPYHFDITQISECDLLKAFDYN